MKWLLIACLVAGMFFPPILVALSPVVAIVLFIGYCATWHANGTPREYPKNSNNNGYYYTVTTTKKANPAKPY